MQGRILVTGATGNVGSELLRILQQRGEPAVAAVSSEASRARLPDPSGPAVRFDFWNPATYPPAFEGIDRLFLMRPPAISDANKAIKPVIDYAQQAGIRNIVFLSLIGAEKNRFVPHAAVERLLLTRSIPYTLLRAGFFMQNLSTTHRVDIQERDEIFVPAGKGKTAFIDVRDIAAVAAKALTESGHENKAYALTGGEALDYAAVAAIMSEILGRRIVYSDPSPAYFAWQLRRRGEPLSYVGVVTAIYMTTRFGLAEEVTPDTAHLLGRQPITMRQFVLDHAPLWARA